MAELRLIGHLVGPTGCATRIAPRPGLPTGPTRHVFRISIRECRRYTIDSVPDCRDGPSNSLLTLAVWLVLLHSYCDQRLQVGRM